MIIFLRTSLICFLAFILTSTESLAVKTFENEIERDLVIKKTLPIYLQHKIGNVSVQGWVQDRIRVTLKQRVFADSEAQAKVQFQKLELISFEGADRLELRVGHAQGVDLVSKLRDREQNPVQVDLEIKAPFQSDLTLVLGEGKSLKIDSLRGGLTMTGKHNAISLTKLALTKSISLNCTDCSAEIKDSKMGGHLLLGSKGVLLSGVEADPSLSIDESNEEIRVENSRGNLSVNSKNGRLSVAKFQGNLNFQSNEGGADISGFQGNFNAQTQTGQVFFDAESIKNSVNIDTEKSDIQISVPSQFECALDLMSLRGEVVVQFPYEVKRVPGGEVYGPPSPGRVDGQIGAHNGIILHAYSKQGGVRILRKAPAR